MGEQDRLIVATAEDIANLRQEVRELREMLFGAMVVPPPDWLSISEAARAMGVSTDTVRRRIASGRMEARGSGRLREVKVPQSKRNASSSASDSK